MYRRIKDKLTRWNALATDRRLALGVLIVFTCFALAYLVTWTRTIGYECSVEPSWFTPSILLASGQGFFAISEVDPPVSVQTFLSQRELWLDVREVPENIRKTGPDPFMQCHRYLLYAVAAVWWVFGISWGSLKLFAALAFGITAAIVYGLFRLGLSRLVSLLLTALFMVSPGLLTMLPSIRDFCKAPFVLGAILLIGYLLKYPQSRRKYLLLSAGLGLIIGVGLGFRQDVLVCIVPAVFVVALGARGLSPLRAGSRVLAVLLLLSSFLLPGWPILSAMHRTSGNTGHYLLQGMDLSSVDELELQNASYQCVFSNNDNFVHATVLSYDRRQHPDAATRRPMDFWSSEVDAAGKDLMRRFLWTFPADFLTRGYASARWMASRGLDGPYDYGPCLRHMHARLLPLDQHLRRWGLLYAALALVIVGSQNLFLALMAFVLCMFFGGYTGLQFHYRHAFHLGFASLWFPAFVFESVFLAVVGCLSHRLGNGAWNASMMPNMKKGALRVLCTAALALALLLLPLYSLRLYQRLALGPVFEAYAHADLEAVPVTQQVMGDQVLFTLNTPLASLQCPEDLPLYEVGSDYLAAEFSASEASRPITLKYEAENEAVNFTQTLSVPAARKGDTGPTRQFFPVYACAAPKAFTPGQTPPSGAEQWCRGRFLGVSVPAQYAAGFKGLYRVRNAAQFPMFLGLSLPADPAGLRYGLSLGIQKGSTGGATERP